MLICFRSVATVVEDNTRQLVSDLQFGAANMASSSARRASIEATTSTPVRPCGFAIRRSASTGSTFDVSAVQEVRGNPVVQFGTAEHDFLTDTALNGVFDGSEFTEEDFAPDERYELDMSRALELSKHDVGKVAGWGKHFFPYFLTNVYYVDSSIL